MPDKGVARFPAPSRSPGSTPASQHQTTEISGTEAALPDTSSRGEITLRCRLRFDRLAAADRNLNLLRLGFGALLEFDLQNTGVVAGLHVLRIDRVGNCEGAIEAAVTAIDAVEVLFLLLFFELALAADSQRVVFDAYVEVFLLHARHFELEDDFVFILINVHRGSEGGSRQCVSFALTTGEVLEDRVHTVLQSEYVAKWVPTSDSHGFLQLSVQRYEAGILALQNI